MNNWRNEGGRVNLGENREKFNKIQEKILCKESMKDSPKLQNKPHTQDEKDNQKNTLPYHRVVTGFQPSQKPLNLDQTSQSYSFNPSYRPPHGYGLMREPRPVTMVSQSQQTSQINNMEEVSQESKQYEKMQIEEPYPINPTYSINPEIHETSGTPETFISYQVCLYCRQNMLLAPIVYCHDCSREFVHNPPCAYRIGAVRRVSNGKIEWFCNNCKDRHYITLF